MEDLHCLCDFKIWLQNGRMSFVSKAWSTETLTRGMDLVRADSLSLQSDPGQEDLAKELARLQVP